MTVIPFPSPREISARQTAVLEKLTGIAVVMLHIGEPATARQIAAFVAESDLPDREMLAPEVDDLLAANAAGGLGPFAPVKMFARAPREGEEAWVFSKAFRDYLVASEWRFHPPDGADKPAAT